MEKSQLDLLVKHINEFDCYYEMSDSNSNYFQNIKIKKMIRSQLNSLEVESKDYIKSKLDSSGKISWERYFK